MTIKETFAKIADLLSPYNLEKEEVVEVTLESQKLSDGTTVVEAESFEAGQAIFIIAEDGTQIPMPVGTYEMEDGSILEVVEEGMIDSITAAEAVEDEVPTEEEEEVEAESEVADVVEDVVEDEVVDDVEPDTVSRTEFDEAIAKINTSIDDLKSELALSKVTLGEKETKIKELELSLSTEPASKKINHSPDDSKSKIITNDSNKKLTKFDRIINELNQ